MKRRESEICVLPDGRKIAFNLTKRSDDTYFSVRWRDGGKQFERSTKETSRKQAREEAHRLIAGQQPEGKVVSWDDAVQLLREHTAAANLRPVTVEQYEIAIRLFREWATDTRGPADVTPVMVERFKQHRMGLKLSPVTVKGNLHNLNVVYEKWWKGGAKIVAQNPFAEVEPPRIDKKPPRIIEPDEQTAFLNWMTENWFRLPVLLLEVKARIGCRIGELCAARTADLRDGRIHFAANVAKGRKERASRLPAAMFAELKSIAGPTYVFERFADELRAHYVKRGRGRQAQAVGDFRPAQLKNWLQDRKADYLEESGSPWFKLHNFRGTAMSRARKAGVSYDDAAIAFGCHPETMRQHYVKIDETSVSDSVMAAIDGVSEISPQTPHKPGRNEGKSGETTGNHSERQSA